RAIARGAGAAPAVARRAVQARSHRWGARDAPPKPPAFRAGSQSRPSASAARGGDRVSPDVAISDQEFHLLRRLIHPHAGLASDIDTDVLAHAAEGVYPMEQVTPVPRPMLPKYFLRGTGPRDGFVRLKPAVRSLVTFRRINFLDDPWPIRTRFDAIFCRNVL